MARARRITGAAARPRARLARNEALADAPRLRLDTEERRARLLDLGLSLFGERSYEEISIDDIAERAGMSKGLLYHYFKSKRGFYVATVRQAAKALVAHVTPDKGLAPADRLQVGLDAYLTFVDAHARAYVALMQSGIGADAEVRAIVEETRLAIMRRILEEGLGFTDPPPVFRVVLRSWIGAVEAASLDWVERRDLPKTTVVTLLAGALVETLAAAARVAPSVKLPRAK
jgi:AcrR family transcriptional regulator